MLLLRIRYQQPVATAIINSYTLLFSKGFVEVLHNNESFYHRQISSGSGFTMKWKHFIIKLWPFRKTLPYIRRGCSILITGHCLEKALEAGQISFSDYLLGLSVYYDAVDNLLETKPNALMAYYSMYRFY